MRKRLFALTLAALLALGLTGCAARTEKPQSSPSLSPSPDPSWEASAAPAADGEILLSFLSGETRAAVDDDFYNDLAFVESDALNGAREFSFGELTQVVDSAVEFEDFQGTEVSYALLETLSGRQMLAVRYAYEPNPQGTWAFWSYFIFGLYGGEVRLTYAEDSWFRNFTMLRQGLVFSGTGSGGAGDEYSWFGYIDDTGHYHSVYQEEILSGQWVAMYAHPVFDGDTDWAVGCWCDILTTDEGVSYQLDAGEDTDPEKLELLKEYLTEQGMARIDSAQEAIAQAKEIHGVEDTPLFQDWIPWESQG